MIRRFLEELRCIVRDVFTIPASAIRSALPIGFLARTKLFYAARSAVSAMSVILSLEGTSYYFVYTENYSSVSKQRTIQIALETQDDGHC